MTDTNIKKLNETEIEIEAKIASDQFEKYWNEVVTYLGKDLKIDGFRPGKAPESKVVEMVGELKILEEMASRAISDWYPKFLVDENIDALGRPEIAITKMAKGNPLEFRVKQSVLPEIKLPNYKKVSSEALKNHKDEDLEITDEEIDRIINELRRQRKKDPNDEKEIAPAFNDEFAQSLGEFKTAQELKDRITENAKKEKEMIAESKRRETIVKAVVDATELSVPEPLIKREQDAQIAQMRADVSRMGAKFEDYLKQVNKTEEQIRDDIKDQATKRAKTNLIIESIAKNEKIEADREELDREVEKMLTYYKDADPMSARQYVENVLKNEKVFKLLEGRES